MRLFHLAQSGGWNVVEHAIFLPASLEGVYDKVGRRQRARWSALWTCRVSDELSLATASDGRRRLGRLFSA